MRKEIIAKDVWQLLRQFNVSTFNSIMPYQDS